MSTLIEVKEAGQRFTTRRGVIDALQDVSLTLEGGEVVCLVGESGSGKTTLGKMIAGLRRELGCLFNREPVPQRMQSCPQGEVGFMPVRAIQPLHQVLEPDVGFMYSPIEDFETRCTHLVNDCIFGAIAADYGACA